jgi:hypothetical protein
MPMKTKLSRKAFTKRTRDGFEDELRAFTSVCPPIIGFLLRWWRFRS